MAAKKRKRKKRSTKGRPLILSDYRKVWHDMRNADIDASMPETMKKSFKKHGFCAEK